jgi:hypothetical protein
VVLQSVRAVALPVVGGLAGADVQHELQVWLEQLTFQVVIAPQSRSDRVTLSVVNISL